MVIFTEPRTTTVRLHFSGYYRRVLFIYFQPENVLDFIMIHPECGSPIFWFPYVVILQHHTHYFIGVSEFIICSSLIWLFSSVFISCSSFTITDTNGYVMFVTIPNGAIKYEKTVCNLWCFIDSHVGFQSGGRHKFVTVMGAQDWH